MLELSASILFSFLAMNQTDQTSRCSASFSEIVASYVAQEIKLDAAHPATEWQEASPVVFCSDWQGENPNPGRETRVRVLGDPRSLYLSLERRYRALYLVPDALPNGHPDRIWDRYV